MGVDGILNTLGINTDSAKRQDTCMRSLQETDPVEQGIWSNLTPDEMKDNPTCRAKIGLITKDMDINDTRKTEQKVRELRAEEANNLCANLDKKGTDQIDAVRVNEAQIASLDRRIAETTDPKKRNTLSLLKNEVIQEKLKAEQAFTNRVLDKKGSIGNGTPTDRKFGDATTGYRIYSERLTDLRDKKIQYSECVENGKYKKEVGEMYSTSIKN